MKNEIWIEQIINSSSEVKEIDLEPDIASSILYNVLNRKDVTKLSASNIARLSVAASLILGINSYVFFNSFRGKVKNEETRETTESISIANSFDTGTTYTY
jgi:hypothetical protein